MEASSSSRAGRSRPPLVSVVTVNYNGFPLLADLLESLRGQTYRNHEVVVVDNASTDGSVELLRRRFPEARVLQQTRNLGFAEGNNTGIRAAEGEFLALANNDTVADPAWLEELVRTANEDSRIAAVASKLLFLTRFLPVRLEAEGGMLYGEETGIEGCAYQKPILREGFRTSDVVNGHRVHRVPAAATVFLPTRPEAGGVRLRLLASAGDVARSQLRVQVGSGSPVTLDLDDRLRHYLLDIPAAVVETDSFDLINNAGTTLSASGNAADRGIYQPDRGQYDREEDVEAICGAAVLLRRSALEDVGLFDRSFFLYYEDTDLSWRLRRAGYRLRYQPRSTIRHVHAASSVEWSPLFTFHTARNRVLMIAKNGGPGAFVSAYARELGLLLRLLVRWRRGRRLPGAERDRQELVTRLRVHRSLLVQIPRALGKRAGLGVDRLLRPPDRPDRR